MPRGDTRFSGGTSSGWLSPSTVADRVDLSGLSNAPTDWTTVPTYADEFWFGSAEAAPLEYLIWISDPRTGRRGQVSYEQLIMEGVLEKGLSVFDLQKLTIGGDLQGMIDNLGSGGSGSRGSGGATGPVYVKPDERMVRESVKGMLAALAGTVDDGKLNELTKLYMDEHRRSFTVRETEQLDPMESVKAAIRNTSEYKAIHTLRPESTDEYTWITQRQGALKRAGVTDIMSEKLGIAQATAGSSDEEAATAGNVATFSQSTQQLGELRNKIRSATYGALQLA